MKKTSWFSMLPLGVCLLAALLPASHIVAEMYGYSLTFYCGWVMVLILTAGQTAMLAALIFSKQKLNKFGEICAALMSPMVVQCTIISLLFMEKGDGMTIAGLWLIVWSAVAFYKRVGGKWLKAGMGFISVLMIGAFVLLGMIVSDIDMETPDLTSEDGQKRAHYVSSISPDESEIAEAYFANGLPHLRVRETNDGIDLKIARLNKRPIFIQFGGSAAIQSIEWKDENTLWIDNEAAYPIER